MATHRASTRAGHPRRRIVAAEIARAAAVVAVAAIGVVAVVGHTTAELPVPAIERGESASAIAAGGAADAERPVTVDVRPRGNRLRSHPSASSAERDTLSLGMLRPPFDRDRLGFGFGRGGRRSESSPKHAARPDRNPPGHSQAVPAVAGPAVAPPAAPAVRAPEIAVATAPAPAAKKPGKATKPAPEPAPAPAEERKQETSDAKAEKTSGGKAEKQSKPAKSGSDKGPKNK